MGTILARARRTGSAFAMALVCGLFCAQAWLYRGFFVDDAFISFRYVRQFIAGNGLVYNLGERVEGYSNFLWIIMLAPFGYAGLDLVLTSRVLGWALSLLTIMLTWRLARRLPFPLLSPLLLAATAPFVAWAVGGLETPLFTFLLTASALVFIREEEQQRGWGSGPLFGLLALTRPEGLLFALVAAGYRLWRLRSSGAAPSSDDRARALSFLAIVGTYYAWRMLYYGYPLPNTVYAKSMGLFNPRAWLEGGYYLYRSALVSGGLLGALLALALLFSPPAPPAWASYLAANLVAYALFVVVAGGDWMPMQRFAVHVLPLLIVLVHAGLARLPALWPGPRAPALVVLLALGQAAYLLMGSLEQRLIDGVGRGPAAIAVEASPRVRYLRATMSPEDVIAVDEAGALAYGLPLTTRVIDLNGLADAHIAHRPAQFPGGLFGRGDGFGKWDIEYVLAQSPRFVQVALTGVDGAGRYTTLNTGQTLLVNDPRFRARYRAVTQPGVDGLFERR